MAEIFMWSCVTALVLFFGFLGFRVFKTVRKLRSPTNLSPSSSGLKPDDKMLRTAAKMGGISVQEARRRLGAPEPSPVVAATRSPGSASVYAASTPRPTRGGRSRNAKARKRRKAANRSRAINRNKRKK